MVTANWTRPSARPPARHSLRGAIAEALSGATVPLTAVAGAGTAKPPSVVVVAGTVMPTSAAVVAATAARKSKPCNRGIDLIKAPVFRRFFLFRAAWPSETFPFADSY